MVVKKKKPECDVTFKTMDSVWVPTILTLDHQPLVDMLLWQPVKDVVCLPAEDDVRIYCMGVNERARGITVEEKIQQGEGAV